MKSPNPLKKPTLTLQPFEKEQTLKIQIPSFEGKVENKIPQEPFFATEVQAPLKTYLYTLYFQLQSSSPF